MDDGTSAASESMDCAPLPQVVGPALSAFENKLVNKLIGNGDIKISVIFRMRYDRWPLSHEHNRYQQQIVGSAISRLNRKLTISGQRIVPGARRRTYRLIPI